MKKEDFIVLAEKYAAGNCTAEEKFVVENYFDRLQEAEISYDDKFLAEKRNIILNYIYSNIKPVAKIKNFTPWKQVMKVAASVVILAGLAFTYMLLTKETAMIMQMAAKGEKKEVLFNDGSVIVLNGNSSISYPEVFGNTRNIELTGEAYFKVQRNPQKPFIVKTKNVDVKVLGTSFNINAYNKTSTKVSVITGRVEVLGEDGKKVILTRDEQANYSTSESFTLTKDKSCEGIAWTRNIIMLNNTTLGETAKTLENWYNVKIEFENKDMELLTISGKFKDEKLENVL